jgi:cold-inducible RNA-binding protein
MSNKVFVGGLAWATDSDRLRSAFEKYGEIVEATVITDRDTGRSRGFGFVTFSGGEAMKQAISAMDGADLDGRSVRVNEAAERPPRSSGGGGGFGRGGGRRSGGR